MNAFSVDGFLGTRASFSLDSVFILLGILVPLLGASIWLARRGRWQLHRQIQLLLSGVLAAALTLFELDMRLGGGWRERAAASPYFAAPSQASQFWDAICKDLLCMETTPGLVFRLLAIHLVAAVSTTLLWIWTLVGALRRFPNSPQPNDYSARHARLGWLTAIGMLLTAVTGWSFYGIAFVAK